MATFQVGVADLCQIRSALQAQWNGLKLLIESEAGQWKLEVRDSVTSQTLYAGNRGSEAAAKVACLEFAVFQVPGAASYLRPELVARELAWKRSW